MKKFMVVATIASLYSLAASAQKLKESQVPAAVISTFQKEYPNINATWDKENAAYEANFKKDGKEMSVIIDETGGIIETETMIAVSDLPAPIFDYMNKHYKGVKVKEAAKIVKANGDINYEAEIKKKDIVFDAKGNLLKEPED
jgi:Putative beta-lactamase-inhibitor-like, PepSY-like